MSKYKNLGLLGQGVFSSVYLAENDQGQKFALKYYTNKESDAVRQKYTVEASTLIQLDNPNILKVHDFGEDELGMYIAMDYMEFGNLRDRISRKGALDLERTLVVAISIIRALETFHNAGKIHKDIRPENLFNSTDGYLKVADFGTLINHVSLSSLPVETVYYTAPEVLENAPDIDCRADIYSLGATLFHIFTGQAVYHSENTIDVVNMHLTDQPVALSNYVADCPESFVAIIQKMMSFNKQDRYQDIYELEKDLQVVMTGMTSVEDLPSYQSPGATLVAPIVLADYREEEIEVVASVDTEVKLETLTGKDEGVLTAESGKPVRKHLDMSNIKLHWHMKLLVACAWLIGPVILGVYVYESYFKEKAPAPIVEVEKPKQKLMISANDFALADESPKKKALPTKKALRKPAAKKQNTLSFAKYSEKVLPVELVEIDKRNFFCSFKIKQKAGWLSEVLTLGQRKSSVRLIAIEDSSAVVDVDGSSYRLKIGQKYRLSYNLAMALGGEDFVIFDHESSVDKGYKMVSLDEKVVKIQTPKNKLVSLNVDLDLSSNAIPVTGAVRSELLKRSKGVVTSFVKLDHEYFPILVNSVSKTSINYSMFVNGAVINYGNAAVSTTLAKRYQINFIGSDWVLLKDRKTAKNIRLKVKQQIILKNAAVVSYRNKDHKVSAGENFFGYKVEFKNGQLSFALGSDLIALSADELLAFLPIANDLKKQHKHVECSCYKIEPKVTDKPPVLVGSVTLSKKPTPTDTANKVDDAAKKRLEQEENMQRQKEIDLDVARRKIINLEHFLMFSTIKVSKRTFSGQYSYSTSVIGHYLYRDGALMHDPHFEKNNRLELDHFEVTSRSFKIKGEKVKFSNYGYSAAFQVRISDTEHYVVEFVPNNYFTVKRLIKYTTVSLGTGYYYLGGKYASIGGRNRKIKIKLDDDNHQIIIDDIPYKLEFSSDYVYLVNEDGAKGSVSFSDSMYSQAR